MRKVALLLLAALPACTEEANHLGNPLLLPFGGVAAAFQNANYAATRSKVELYVKTNHPALIADLRAGGGPTLNAAYEIAGTPQNVRAPHTLQMQSDLALYQANLDALIVAIMVMSEA